MAGLLGIGGGLVIVPALAYILPVAGIPKDLAMPMALATSLASIFITSIFATVAHHKNQNVPWKIAKQLFWLVGIGAGIGAYIADQLSTKALTNLFAGAVLILACYMLYAIGSKQEATAQASDGTIKLVGFITGGIASLMGIAGGAILIPVLTYFSMPLRHVIGVATVCGVAVSIFGSVVFIATGWGEDGLPPYSLGYIYLPALLGIILSSSLFAKYGVTMAAKLPTRTIKKCFAGFLILVAIRMMWS